MYLCMRIVMHVLSIAIATYVAMRISQDGQAALHMHDRPRQIAS